MTFHRKAEGKDLDVKSCPAFVMLAGIYGLTVIFWKPLKASG